MTDTQFSKEMCVREDTCLLFKIDDQELVDEGDVVAGVVAMPDGQEDEGPGLAEQPVVEEAEPLVHVRHDPRVRVDVEAVDQLEGESNNFRIEKNNKIICFREPGVDIMILKMLS
jgi:hypothetical protein